MNTAVYIITTCDKDDVNFYKIGYHKGSQMELLGKYQYLGRPIIMYYIRHTTAFEVYHKVKDEMNVADGTVESGSDWINNDLPLLIDIINKHIREYDRPRVCVQEKKHRYLTIRNLSPRTSLRHRRPMFGLR